MDNNKQIILPLEDVNSDHCALIVENGLNKLSGISDVKVESANKRALLKFDGSENRTNDVVTAVQDLGYGVPSVKKTFPVLQMTCASCATSVESMLNATTGVIKASVNYANAQVNVEYVPQMITPQEMQKVIQSIGYDLIISEEADADEIIAEIEEENFRKLKKKTIGAVILTLPVVAIGMFFMNMPYANEIMWLLSTPVILFFGRNFFSNALKQAKHRSANMDTLVALSTGIAYIFSVFNTLFPYYWMSKGLHAHVYFEAGAVVISFILLGKLLEEKAKGNTSNAIKKLMGLQPKTVRVIKNGEPVEVPVNEVEKGNIILVKPGEKIAVDGEVEEGESYVDESMLSGEPIPVLKQKGASVYAGTINQKGSLNFVASKVGSDTMLSQIIKTVQEAQGSKAPVQRMVDKIAGVFVPVVIGIALLSFVIWLIFGGDNALTYGLLSLVTVLVIACPCALGLATPTAIMVGVGKAADQGILIKDAESLEIAKKVNAIILDKTGTITEGKPKVTDMFWNKEDQISKRILVSMEHQSEHPLATSVTQKLEQFESVPLQFFESITGRGVHARYDEKAYFVGNRLLLSEKQIQITDSWNEKESKLLREAKTVIWFADENEVLALIGISDRIKKTSAHAIKQLHDEGIDVYMLTGDNAQTAKAIAAQTGISHFKAHVLPHEKAEFVKELQAQGKIVGMVGDGINDSTALAQADLSIAMGHGSDIAMDVAKMTIISSDLNKIPVAIQVSKQTVRAIKQNLFWAFIYNIIGIPLAAGVLYPINGFLLNPMIAGGAMALSSVSVVGNSLRLKLIQ